MNEEVLSENDRLYPLKKWGPDYRTKPEYWTWFTARHAGTNAKRDAEFTAHETPSPTHFVALNALKDGW